MVRRHSTLARLASDGQLAHHNDEAAADRQNEVNNEERKAAGGAHFIGEAPDVAQADRRADRGHQETKIGSKAFSFFHCFLSFTDFSRRTRRAWLYLTVKKRRCKWGHTFLNVPVALRRFFFIHLL